MEETIPPVRLSAAFIILDPKELPKDAILFLNALGFPYLFSSSSESVG